MNNYTINASMLYYFSIYAVAIILVYIAFYIFSYRESEWILQVSFILTIIISMNILFLKKVFGHYLTLTSMFVILLELFNFVPSFMNLLEFKYSEVGLSAADTITIYGFQTYQEVIKIAVFFVLFFCAGAVLSESIRNKKIICLNGDDINVKKFAIFILIISVPADIIMSLYKTINVVSEGYGSNLEQSPVYMLQYISFLVFPGFFLLWSVAEEKSKNHILILFVVYKVLGMFTGQRAESVCAILIAICLYLYSVKIKMTIRKLICILLVMLLIIFLLVFIRSFRQTGYQITNFETLASLGLLNFFAEWNSTNIVAEVVNFTGNHTMGMSTLYSIACVIPGIKSFDIDLYEVDIYYVLNLYRFGSSIIAEIFFDWNYYGLILIFIIGFFIRRLDRKIFIMINNKTYLPVIYWIPFFMQFFYSVRSSTLGWLRSIVFTYVIVTICLKVFGMIYRRSEGE